MRKLSSLLLIVALVIAVLTGCNTPSTTAGTTAGTTAATTTKATTAAATTVATTTAKPVKIEFFQQKEAAAVTPYNKVLEGFMAKNPGIVIEQTYVPDAPQVFATRVASGTVPDLFTHWPERSTYWELCQKDVMLAITDQAYLKKVDPNLLERGKYKGQVYCLPIALLTFGVTYNVDMYKQNNLSIPDTWTKFIANLDALKAKGVAGFTFQLQFNEGIGQQINTFYKMALGDYNANVFFAQLARGETTFAQHPETIDVIKKYLKLTSYMTADSMAADYQKMAQDLINGKCAHYYDGTWRFGTIAGIKKDFNYAMFPMPLFDDVSKNTVPVGIDTALCIAKNTKYKTELLKLLDYVANDAGCLTYCKEMNNTPAISGVNYTVTQLSPMTATINAGKIFRFPHHFWKPGVDLSAANEMVTLVLSKQTDKDIATYCANVEKIFKTAGASDFQADYTVYK